MSTSPRFEKSPWVVHFNCNSCNGCDIELLACLSPLYDLERFGIIHVGNPKHADVLLVTGSVNHRNARVLRNVYDQMPEPKAVVAIGACAGTGGIFKDCYNVLGGVDSVIPVDVYLSGCPVRPEAMIDGVLEAARKLDQKRRGIATTQAAPTVVIKTPQASRTAPAAESAPKPAPLETVA
jgi:ech hydrogenase subunit C